MHVNLIIKNINREKITFFQHWQLSRIKPDYFTQIYIFLFKFKNA